jgi:hypothetical protein
MEKNPNRVLAGLPNRALRGPHAAEGRRRLREAAARNKPWEHSTGPRSEEGRARVAQNGKRGQAGPCSVREARAQIRLVNDLIQQL